MKESSLGSLQVLQTIMLAALLGVTGWAVKTTMQNHDDVMKLQVQFEERSVLIRDIQDTARRGVTMLENLRDADKELDNRIKALEARKP